MLDARVRSGRDGGFMTMLRRIGRYVGRGRLHKVAKLFTKYQSSPRTIDSTPIQLQFAVR